MIAMVMRKGCRCFFGVWLNLVVESQLCAPKKKTIRHTHEVARATLSLHGCCLEDIAIRVSHFNLANFLKMTKPPATPLPPRVHPPSAPCLRCPLPLALQTIVPLYTSLPASCPSCCCLLFGVFFLPLFFFLETSPSLALLETRNELFFFYSLCASLYFPGSLARRYHI